MANEVTEIYQKLLASYGPQHWWPADSPLEMAVGAVLTQNTNWRNVERAIDNLRAANLLTADALYRVAIDALAECVRPAGYYRLKARRLKNLIEFLFERHQGSWDHFFAQGLASARQQLLGINGIGPETADSILLYGGGLPIFVADAYTKRILVRHGWLGEKANYHDLQRHFTERLPADATVFNEYHALIVRVGKEYCRPVARCAQCPLQAWLPASGEPC